MKYGGWQRSLNPPPPTSYVATESPDDPSPSPQVLSTAYYQTVQAGYFALEGSLGIYYGGAAILWGVGQGSRA